MLNRDPLGFTLDGMPFWGFAGAQDDDEGGEQGAAAATTDDDGADDGDNTPDENGLTPGGRKLIETEREAAKTAKRALAPWKALEREFGMSPEQIRQKLSTGDDEKTTAAREAAAGVRQEFTRRIVRTEVRALAKDHLADPEDALAFLDLDSFEVDDEGEVDRKTIERELKALAARKPHLAKQTADDDDGGGTVSGFDGGARRTVERPENMTSFIRSAVEAKRGGR